VPRDRIPFAPQSVPGQAGRGGQGPQPHGRLSGPHHRPARIAQPDAGQRQNDRGDRRPARLPRRPFPVRAGTCRPLSPASTWTSRPAAVSPWSAIPAPAKPGPTCCHASRTRNTKHHPWAVRTCAPCRSNGCASSSRSCPRTPKDPVLFDGLGGRESTARPARCQQRGTGERRRGDRRNPG
jgi:hypothetical protein